ncbi:MAG: dipeptidyl aminopeptidase [Rhodoferax sp.]|nr:dipeptidyl aminopeptidase [Rhodoferax sp.]
MRVGLFYLAAGLLGLALAGPLPAQPVTEQVLPEVARLSLLIDGKPSEVVADIYKPAGAGPFPLVIFSHGRAGSSVGRSRLRNPIAVGHGNYWLRQGVAVVAPERPGYGETGGADVEDSGGRWQDARCSGNPDFTRTAEHARRTVLATYEWALQQPWVRKDRILIEGQSVGGMATVATAALNLPGVVGAVNFSGGAGGNPHGSPGKSCVPDNLTETYRQFGRQARVPSLWLYAQNDQYWGPQMPQVWFEAYRAGGSDTELVMTGPVDGYDGHQLLLHGGPMWSAPLGAFVKKVGLLAP